MTPLVLASYIRWKGNVGTASPWDNASLLPIANIAKDNISQAIVQINPDYFGEVSHTDTVQNQQEYTKPSDLLLMKRVEVSYTDSNVGSFYPARVITLSELRGFGEDYYANYTDIAHPMVRFDDTGFFLYPTPGAQSAATFGSALLKLWYVPKRTDFANLTEAVTDIESSTGIGSFFHELIGDIVINQIKYKKGDLTQEDMQDANQHILDVLVPSAFRKLSTVTSSLPPDTALQI